MWVLFFIAPGMAIGHLWQRVEDLRPTLVFLLFIGAYAATYVAGFAYQRNITALLAALTHEAFDRRDRSRA